MAKHCVHSPDNAPYGRVYVLPAQTVGQDTEGQLRTYRGILQLNIIAPAGSGVTQAVGWQRLSQMLSPKVFRWWMVT